jgi:hypothetical protein
LKIKSVILVIFLFLKALILKIVFLKFKPNKIGQVKIYKKAIRDLREFAKDTILKRFKDVENEKYIPNDMLALIIQCSSNY